MARRRPWPVNADDHRLAAIQLAREIQTIADDLDALKEYDRITVKLAAAKLGRHAAHIEKHLTLAKFGQPEEL